MSGRTVQEALSDEMGAISSANHYAEYVRESLLHAANTTTNKRRGGRYRTLMRRLHTIRKALWEMQTICHEEET